MTNNNSNNIILVGFMGSGKTTISGILSAKLGYKFIDTDKLIEEAVNLKISDIFKIYGENYFREIESHEIKKLCTASNSIISTGGGSFCNQININILKEMGNTFYLKTSYEFLIKRFSTEEINKRPLLQNKDNVKDLLLSRENFYSQAENIILTDGKTPEEISEMIISLI